MSDKKEIIGFLQNNKKLVVMLVAGAVIAYGVFFSGGTKNNPPKQGAVERKGNVTENDKLLSVIEGLKKDVEELKKNQGTTKQNITPENTGAVPKASEQKKTESLTALQKMIKGESAEEGGREKTALPVQNGQTQQGLTMQPMQAAPKPENRLIKIDVSQVEPKGTQQTVEASSNDLFLPAGSFVSFTLKTSVFAPDAGEQMPTSGVLDAAFVGPNKSTVPMKGCFFIGKAKGNTAEKMADIKPIRFSCVWPNGETFEADTAGYVTDLYGHFGLKGEVDRHTGTFLSTVGITSALEGFAQGLNKAQTATSTLVANSASATSTNINGSPWQYGGFAGLSDMATSAKAFFAAQMQNLIPTVKIEPGERGYIHLTAGIKIPGGKKNVAGNLTSYPYTYNLSSAH